MNKNIRKQFPILKQKINGKPSIYLDSSATTQKPQIVIDAITDYYKRYNSNIHRSSHALAKEATNRWVEAHKIVADFLNAKTYEEIIFTRNCTEGINLFVQTYTKSHLKKGDIVLLTEMEHHSNIVPWMMAQKDIGFEIEYIPVTDKYVLDMDWLEEYLDENKGKVKVISLVHISNVLGVINDVKQITKVAHSAGAICMVDAAQSVARLPIDVQDMNCDALTFSGHKIYGPTGSGVIYIKKEILETLPPYMGGGEMMKEVNRETFTPNDLPWRYEAGTPNVAAGIALGEAIKWFSNTVEEVGGYENLINHERELVDRFISSFDGLDWFKLFGSKDRVGAISFNITGFTFEGCHKSNETSDDKGKKILEFISSQGVCLRDGFHCAQPLHSKFDNGPTMRVSLGIYTDQKDIDRAVQIIKQGVLRTL